MENQWLIIFDDDERSMLTFDTELEARLAYAEVVIKWDCNLYAPIQKFSEAKDCIRDLLTANGDLVKWLTAVKAAEAFLSASGEAETKE